MYNELVFKLLCDRFGEGEAVLFARSSTVNGQRYAGCDGSKRLVLFIYWGAVLEGFLSIGEVIVSRHGKPWRRLCVGCYHSPLLDLVLHHTTLEGSRFVFSETSRTPFLIF
jgi:hypothetical protein